MAGATPDTQFEEAAMDFPDEKGEPFEQAIREAGIERMRPVLITVGATILDSERLAD
jgi:hypothetical protein